MLSICTELEEEESSVNPKTGHSANLYKKILLDLKVKNG